MCGISGFFQRKGVADQFEQKLSNANEQLIRRGPDGGACWTSTTAGLGHRRLSIIDTTDNASQPMRDPSGRYTIVFNGEIFNFKALKEQFLSDKTDWQSQSDTEVLLHLFILQGKECLSLLSGFFAFAIYDESNNELFIARDRFGKKPLLYYQTEENFVFASEMKALFAFDIPRRIDFEILSVYLQLNYVPEPYSLVRGVLKLPAGHYMTISKTTTTVKQYYKLNLHPEKYGHLTYDEAKKRLETLMDNAVKQRLLSDVPLGSFLSGGIDSSVIVALASRHTEKLKTFSIGYKDNPFFDETYYANLVAKKYKTEHTVFSLTSNDFLEHVQSVLDYIDEPFADSSAIPEFILSYYTRKHVTVALSGDGGDEVFAGYHKHAAELRVRNGGPLNALVKAGFPIWNALPKSRSSKITNKIRQLERFAKGSRLSPSKRYWQWASFLNQQTANNLISENLRQKITNDFQTTLEHHYVQHIAGKDFNEVLLADMQLVLVSDMLVKVDLMSMANSLEIRSPFLDKEVVEFAFGLPSEYKIDNRLKKKILQDTFRHQLPAELYNRPKKGFEIPMLNWLRNELWSMIDLSLLSDNFISEQGLFDKKAVSALKSKLKSNNPEDSHATIWALVVFQSWWKKYEIQL